LGQTSHATNEIPQHPVDSAMQCLLDALFQHDIDLSFAKRALEIHYIQRLLANHKGNISQCARSMGVHRNTLARHMKELGIGDD
jgi:ActR/RegA family two-component response regulator